MYMHVHAQYMKNSKRQHAATVHVHALFASVCTVQIGGGCI